MAHVTCYGGVGEIGGNKIRLDIADSSLFLDFGLSYRAQGEFFEEYLQPRSTSALHDYLDLGLVPPLDGLYRRDALQPDGFDPDAAGQAARYWTRDLTSYEAAADRGEWTPDAVFVSHAHLDHVGHLPYLGDVPLVLSETTETLLEAIPDVGAMHGFEDELLAIERREFDELGGGYFPGAPKINTGDPEPRTTHTLAGRARHRVSPVVDIEAIPVGHSIPGSRAALIESDDTQVVYTGDLRFHGRQATTIQEAFAGLRPDIMISEGTRIGEATPDDESQVEADLTEIARSTDGLLLVGFAWKDLERYESVRNAAKAAGRTPVFDPRLAYLKARLGESIYGDGARVFVERQGSMLYSPGDYVRGKHKASELPVGEWDSSEGVADTTHLEQGVTAADIRQRPEEYVLHLDYYRFNNLIDLDPPPGSRYVRAQTEPFNVEMELSEQRLTNWLAHFDLNAENNHEPLQIHASGHASGPEIQALVDVIEPDVVIPIHTQHPGLFENRSGEVRLPLLGDRISV